MQNARFALFGNLLAGSLSLYCVVFLFCCPSKTGAVTETLVGYSIPADAIRIQTEELAAEHLTFHLAELMQTINSTSTASSYATSTTADGEELRRAGDHHQAFPTALIRLNALLQAAEERKKKLESTAATSRLLSINRGAYFRGLLVVWVPVSFLLPTLAQHHPPTTYYRQWRSSHWKSNIQSMADGGDGSSSRRRISNQNQVHGYDPNASDYKFDAHYGPLLSRLEGYFALLRIDNLDCQWKLLCYCSQDANTYQPLSNLFSRLFERSQSRIKSSYGTNQEQQQQYSYHPALKKFFTYIWANKKGTRYSSTEQCDAEYSQCTTAIDRLVRMDMFRFWQNLSKRFAIQLQDE